MTARMLYFVIGALVFVSAVAGAFTYQLQRARRTSRATWDGLLKQLITVDRQNIERVARDMFDAKGNLREDKLSRSLTAREVWDLVGGIEGLELLARNSQIFLQMAAYVKEWHPDDDLAAEELRLKAREIQYQLEKLRMAERAGKLEGWFANYAQHAVGNYFLMSQRLLELYNDAPPKMRMLIRQRV